MRARLAAEILVHLNQLAVVYDFLGEDIGRRVAVFHLELRPAPCEDLILRNLSQVSSTPGGSSSSTDIVITGIGGASTSSVSSAEDLSQSDPSQ